MQLWRAGTWMVSWNMKSWNMMPWNMNHDGHVLSRSASMWWLQSGQALLSPVSAASFCREWSPARLEVMARYWTPWSRGLVVTMPSRHRKGLPMSASWSRPDGQTKLNGICRSTRWTKPRPTFLAFTACGFDIMGHVWACFMEHERCHGTRMLSWDMFSWRCMLSWDMMACNNDVMQHDVSKYVRHELSWCVTSWW